MRRLLRLINTKSSDPPLVRKVLSTDHASVIFIMGQKHLVRPLLNHPPFIKHDDEIGIAKAISQVIWAGRRPCGGLTMSGRRARSSKTRSELTVAFWSVSFIFASCRKGW